MGKGQAFLAANHFSTLAKEKYQKLIHQTLQKCINTDNELDSKETFTPNTESKT
jgi:hypothetical protein